MKPIKFPVEHFFWNLKDGMGNSRIEIRDANKNRVFYMSIEGHEYYEEKRLMNELAPLIVNLMNQWAAKTFPDDNAQATPTPKPVDHVQSNGSELVEKKSRGNPWGRAGKPK